MARGSKKKTDYTVRLIGEGVEEKYNGKFKMPMRGCLIGKSGSGKSNLLSNFIVQGWITYDHLYMCVKNPDQPCYAYIQTLAEEEKATDQMSWVTSPLELPVIDDQGKKKEEEEEQEEMLHDSLVVFDDQLMATPKEQRIIDSLYVRGRNAGISVLYLGQDFYRIPLTVRRNTDYWFLFGGMSETDLGMMYKSIGGSVDGADFKRLYHQATGKPYHFLTIDTVKGEYYENLDQEL